MSKLLSLSLLVLSLIQSGMGCNTVSGIKFTAYGFPDASGTPAYACNGNNPVASQPGGKTVLGDGSFNKPYSAAAATGSIFKECELLYMPLLKKYFRVQDNCSGCGQFILVESSTEHINANRPMAHSLQTNRPLHRPIQQRRGPDKL